MKTTPVMRSIAKESLCFLSFSGWRCGLGSAFRVVVGCIVSVAIFTIHVGADKSVQGLESVVNDAGYSLVNPARSDVSPGGFVVATKKHASYNDPPSGITFTPGEFSASIYSSTSRRSFSLAALVNGIAKMVGGGVSVSHDTRLTVKQIDASGQKTDLNAVIANPTVQTQIKKWLTDKKSNYKVYVVDVTLSTTNISVTSSSDTDVAATFAEKPPDCPSGSTTTSATEANSGTGNPGPAPGTTPSSSKTLPSVTAKAGKAGNNTTSGTSSTAAPSASTRSGTLQACVNRNSVVNLSTAKPLVFAASLRPVTLSDDGSLSVSPVSDVANTKGGTHVEPMPKIDWNPKHAQHGVLPSSSQ